MDRKKKILKFIGRRMGIDLRDIPQAANSLWDIDESDGVKRKAVYTDAFWLAPPYGRPRDIDYERLEPLEKNAWVRMCVQHVIDSIVGAEYNIVPRKKGKEVSGTVLDEARDFFEGDWQEDWKTNLRMMLPDLLHYDCGVTIKAFPLTSYEEDGALKDKIDKIKPVELYSRDGRSFMKDTGLAGRLRQYWQYSWINPQGRPIRFSPDEIMYYQMNPSSRSPYGIANLEVIEFIVDYMIDSAMAQSKYWKNGMFIGGQIDLPEIKELDELKRQQAYYEAKLRGPKKMGKWLVTGGGATIKSIPFTPQQMQWVESQKWFAKIIFGIYKVTPSELGFTEDLNRATGLQQMEIHKSKAIRPVLTLIEDMMNRQVIWKYFSKDIKFEYVMELSLDDKGKQTDIDIKRLDKGLDSVNELRDRDGLDKWGSEKWDKPTGDEEEQQEEEEDDFDWDSYFGGSDEDEDLNVTEEDMKKGFSKGGPGSGPVKGHKRDMPEIKRMDEDYAGMEIQQVRRKLLNYYAPGEIRDMESKNGEKSLRARLQSAVTGKPVSFKKAAMASALSGEPGYVPMPEVYDGMGKPIKTKKNEKKIIDLVSVMYKEIQEEIDEEWDRLFGKGIEKGGPGSGIRGHKTHKEEKHGFAYGINILELKGTEEEIEGVFLGKTELGECYNNAGRYLLDHPYVEGKLVHGTANLIKGLPLEFGHGWVELPNNKVFDGTANKFFKKDDYYKKLKVAKEKEYEYEEMATMMLKHETWGPWHLTEGIIK